MDWVGSAYVPLTEVEIRQKELIEAREFEIKQKELLELLPEEFRYFVKHQAWQDGHSAGYQEVLGIVNDLTYNLLEPIRQYTARIIKNRKTLVNEMLKKDIPLSDIEDYLDQLENAE